jgi:hypothetical protein
MKRLDEQGRLEYYRELMEEVRHRFDVLNVTLANTAKLDVRFVREICYLQFRYLCEFIARACLVAQGNLTKRLIDHYEPYKIISELHEFNPHLYPQPVRVTKVGNKTMVTGISDQIKFLKRDDLPKLWGKCGDVLHISPFMQTLKEKPDTISTLSDVQDVFEDIAALLKEHLLVLSRGKESPKALVVNLYAPYFDGRPAVHLINWSFTPQPSP